MKIAIAESFFFAGTSRSRERALTLVEMIVSMSLFSLVTLGLVYCHMFGMKQDQLVQSKLGASDQSRRSFDLLQRDVRASKYWQIGNGGLTTFAPIANGSLQQGNALKVLPTTSTNSFTVYYFDTAKRELRRRQSGATTSKMIAQNLTNTMYFRAESYRGSNVYDLTHKAVVHCWMEFAQYQFPLTKVGPTYFYNYYKIEFRLSSHVPDGP